MSYHWLICQFNKAELSRSLVKPVSFSASWARERFRARLAPHVSRQVHSATLTVIQADRGSGRYLWHDSCLWCPVLLSELSKWSQWRGTSCERSNCSSHAEFHFIVYSQKKLRSIKQPILFVFFFKVRWWTSLTTGLRHILCEFNFGFCFSVTRKKPFVSSFCFSICKLNIYI